MFSTIIAIIGIMVFTILIIFLICLMLQEKIEKSIYKIPFISSFILFKKKFIDSMFDRNCESCYTID